VKSFRRSFILSFSILVLSGSLFSFASADITTGLAGYWTFDEGAGTTAGDSSGSNTGTLINGATWTTGNIGSGAVSLDGVDGRVDLGDISGIENVSAATWAFWTKPESLVASSIYMAKYNDNGAQVSFRIVQSNSGCGGGPDDIAIYFNSGTCAVTNSNFLSAGTWSHVAIVFDGTTTGNSNRIKIYANGVERTVSFVSTIPSSLPATASNVVLGAYSNNKGPFANGAMDDVRIYSRALSVSEISELYAYTGSGGGNPAPTAVNGVCGATNNSCTAGTLLDQADSSTQYLWQCAGSNGGSTASCSASIPAGPDTAAPIISSVATASVTSSSALISWTTDEPSDTQIEYGLTTSYGSQTTLSSSLVTSHAQTISGLSPNTTYHYRVRSKDSSNNQAVGTDQTFTTSTEAPAAPVTPASGDIVSNLSAAKRIISWNDNVGVPGGIPDRSTKCVTSACAALENAAAGYKDGTLDASALIQAALVSAPADTHVYIPAGTYLINTPINFNSTKTITDVTLRGAGPGETILKPGGWTAITAGGGGLSTERTVISGATKGATSIVVSDASGITPGKMLLLYQADDPDFYWSRWGEIDRTGQYLMVTAVNGSTVTFEDPLIWDFTLNPRFKYNLYSMVKRSGIEDLTIDADASYSGSMIKFTYTYATWVKNVELKGGTGNDMVGLYVTLRNEIRDSYFHDSFSTSDGYGILGQSGSTDRGATTGLLVENNIFSGLRHAVVLEGDGGGVLAYNYSRNIRWGSWPNYLVPDFNTNHGPHGMMLLFEGNIAAELQSDGYHGSASHQTLFRNWFSAKHTDAARTGNRIAVDLTRYSYYHNIVGNILGDPSWTPTWYEMAGMPTYPQTQSIYRLGYPNVGNNGYCQNIGEYWYSAGCTTVFKSNEGKAYGWIDTKVEDTLVRWGNYDYKNNSAQWNAGEVASGVTAPSSQSLPSSLYLSSKPSWFGSLTWPAIGPDVSGLKNDIPAKYCYDRGLMPDCLVGSGSSSSSGGGSSSTHTPSTPSSNNTPSTPSTPSFPSTIAPSVQKPAVLGYVSPSETCASSATSTYIFSSNISIGTTHKDVKILQELLNGNGYAVSLSGPGSKGRETDLYGPATQKAVQKLQSAYKVTPTGNFGSITRLVASTLPYRASSSCIATSTSPTALSTYTFTRALDVGSVGEDVRQLQSFLSALPPSTSSGQAIYPEKLVTGTFGPLTQRAVGRFQELHGLAKPGDPAYGFVGPGTRGKLNSLTR
jgi:peptidoglycan hydrolase-like protein with peptidoglycan-binding domain